MRYIITATDREPVEASYWSDALTAAVTAWRAGAEHIEIRATDGQLLARHDATGWDMAPEEEARTDLVS